MRVDRAAWDRTVPGPGDIQRGALLNRRGTRSILGLYLSSLGVPDSDLLDWALPFKAARKHELPAHLQDPAWVDAVLRAESSLDENALARLFAEVGVQIEFVGEGSKR